MQRTRTLYFTGPGQVEIREFALPPIKDEEVLVETVCSAISAGTEMLVYQGQFPEIEDQHDRLSSELKYPLTYGYACAGRVIEIGREVDPQWQERMVFSFNPHCSHFKTNPNSLIPLPPSLSLETACFLPNMETAVNLIQDGAPILGERVLVLGQGIVGLLTASLLDEFPLDLLVTADRYELRRKALTHEGSRIKNHFSLDPGEKDFQTLAKARLSPAADLSFELSGSPSALNAAISLTRFSGRVVIGSWYGAKRADIDLGGGFHRSRIKLISSQVSTIAPELVGRWDKARRFEVTWEALKRINPARWITHRFPFENASRAYHLLDTSPQETIQVMFDFC